jgi:SpoVK/Ycf46/Vps4 family AAA+-type ATPase
MMDRYETHLLRQYTLNALEAGKSGPVKSPKVPLAYWLFEHCEAMSCPAPELSIYDIDGGHRLNPKHWSTFAPVLAALRRTRAAPPPSPMEVRLHWLGATLGLSELERDILRATVRVAMIKPVTDLAKAIEGAGGRDVNPRGLLVFTGRSASDINRALQPGRALRLLGLIEDRGGGDVGPTSTVERIARLPTTDPAGLRRLLVGRPRKAELAWEDFAHLGEAATLAERMLNGALARRTPGINLLLHGAPGTGKTEFVRTLAERLGAHAMFVGETDDGDGEPSRGERVTAYAVARALASRAGRTLLVVDEADDIFTGVDGDDARSRVGSKVFMNRLVEKTAAPTVWITNQRDRLGAAVLRRMALAIRFPEPGLEVRRRVAGRIARRRGLRLSAGALDGLARLRAAPAIIDSAMRTAKLAGGAREDIESAARSIVQAMEGAPPPPALGGGMAFDPTLSAADHDLAEVAERVSRSGQMAISFCLTGAPGTGKSAFARYLAARLGLDVIEKRASDLLSMWLGGSEKNIAGAFQDAADQRAMLVLDEADSLLRDRSLAHYSWEVSQVNEMLTWMERHPYPFACTTNMAEALDPATARRFLFKIRFVAMREDQAREAFRRTFAAEPPSALDELEGLTPGDFALVARRAKLLDERGSGALVAMLAAEVDAKSRGERRRIGF